MILLLYNIFPNFSTPNGNFFKKGGIILKIIGIICEYNPMHLGHKKQIDLIRSANPGCGIVCLMSGNFVQRGHPAIVDKALRAQAALHAGADLVLELPVTASLSSAEGFAAKGVSILSGFCDELSFGAETDDPQLLAKTVDALLSDAFSNCLRGFLDEGLSFPAARQKALEAMGVDTAFLATPNNILAVEYCKAIKQLGCRMRPAPIKREGNYHDIKPDEENPSATALRMLMAESGVWLDYIPACTRDVMSGARIHTTAFAEQAILYRLRTMTEEDYEALPYGSEGLWRKLMHNAHSYTTLEEVLQATKSKRYTRTRLDRMVLCAFLGITGEMLETPIPYTRALACNETGRKILKLARQTGDFPNIGEPMNCPYEQLEYRCDDLYALFSREPEAPGYGRKRRIYML